jgi:hypothetical protein
MERYDYYEMVKEDIRNYIKENYEVEEIKDLEFDDLYDDLFIEDSVTGNASGSYYCNAWKAEEALCHNMELLGEALNVFGCDGSYLEKGAEACDVTIRCYILGQVLEDVIYDLQQELENESEEE